MVPFFYRKPWIIIAACLLVTVFFAVQLPKLQIENNLHEWLDHKNESYIRFHRSNDDFGSTCVIGVSLEKKDGSTVLSPEVLTIVNEISNEVEQIGDVQKVDSLTSIDYVCSEDESLVANSLVDEDLFVFDEASGKDVFIGTQPDIDLIKEKVESWSEMYNRVILSDDYAATQMSITINDKVIDEDGNESIMSSNDQAKILHKVEDIVYKAIDGAGMTCRFYGDPVTSDDAKSYVLHDLVILIPLVTLVVLITLFLSFKTIAGTLLPLISVLMCSIWSCGLMALLDIQFSIISSIIPVALIAVGSAYGIHILAHYYASVDQLRGNITRDKHAEAICRGVKHVTSAVLLAGLTTVVGFISLVTSPIEPLHSFAIFTSFGIVCSMILAFTLIPALLMLKNPRTVQKKTKLLEHSLAKRARNRIRRRLEQIRPGITNRSVYYNIYRVCAGNPIRFAIYCILMIVCSAWGLSKLVIDTALINYFPKSSQLRQDVEYVNNKFAGANALYLIVTSPDHAVVTDENNQVVADSSVVEVAADGEFAEFESFDFDDFDVDSSDLVSSDEEFAEFDSDFSDFGDFDMEEDSAEVVEDDAPVTNMTNPEILKVIDDYAEYIKACHEKVGKVVTFPTFVKRMNQVFNSPNSDDPEYYEIPYDLKKYPQTGNLAKLVSQYLMLIGGETTERFAIPRGSFNPTQVRVQIQLRTHSTQDVQSVVNDTKAYVAEHFPEGYSVEFTGPAEMDLAMTSLIVTSQAMSLVLSIVSVFIILTVSFKSPLAGIIGALPLIFTILLNYMVMGFTGIKLDLITSIIASVAIGVGIDYTIHFMEAFRAERKNASDVDTALVLAFDSSAAGIVTNAAAVGLGFLVMCLSKFIILRYLGILVTIVMFTSSILALTIIPGILKMTDPKFMRK